MKKLINFLKNLFKKDSSSQKPIVTITITSQPNPTSTPMPLIIAVPTDDISSFLLDNGFTVVSQMLIEKALPNNVLLSYDLKTKVLVKSMSSSKVSVNVDDDILRVQKFLRNHGH